jgi:putative hydrolase of the HAD superfamily
MIHTIFFDLDNTLYSRNSGIWEAIGERINLFMTEILHIPEQDILPLRKKFWDEFNTTLMGLQSMFDVDEMEYLNFVHDVDLTAILSDDGQLRQMLSAIPQNKIIFTNSDRAHASRVLSLLEVEDLFERIVDIIAMKPFVKPQPQAYQIALQLAGLETPEGCMFIDDLIENVEQASETGFLSVFVGQTNEDHHAINDIFELPQFLEQYIQANK